MNVVAGAPLESSLFANMLYVKYVLFDWAQQIVFLEGIIVSLKAYGYTLMFSATFTKDKKTSWARLFKTNDVVS